MNSSTFIEGLLPPLLRLIGTMTLGLFIANIMELLQWTKPVARLAAPLTRFAHLQDVASASFATAFFSSYTANALLAESYAKKELSKKELIIANLFNSSPTYLVHLPTLFFLTYSFLGVHALTYVGITLLAAILRTSLTALYGHFFLPIRAKKDCIECSLGKKPRPSLQELLTRSLQSMKRRLWRVLKFTIPIYCLVYFMQTGGALQQLEQWMLEYASFLSFLKPQTLGIVALHVVAESSIALSAASSLLASGGLRAQEVILALLVGNIVASPMRALRHQLPAYAGYFTTDIALVLLVSNQALRCASLFGCTFFYWLLYF